MSAADPHPTSSVRGELDQEPESAELIAVAGVSSKFFARLAETCHGRSVSVDLKKNLYESDYFGPKDQHAKADALEGLLKKIGFGKSFCEKDCSHLENHDCRPVSLKISPTGTDADLSIAEVELFEHTYNRYVLWVKKDTTVTATTGCDCLKRKLS